MYCLLWVCDFFSKNIYLLTLSMRRESYSAGDELFFPLKEAVYWWNKRFIKAVAHARTQADMFSGTCTF